MSFFDQGVAAREAAGLVIARRPSDGDQSTATLSASIAVYRPQAEFFGGRSDGKFGVRLRRSIVISGAYKCRRQLSGSDEGVPFDLATVRESVRKPVNGGKTGKNSGIMRPLIDLPKWEILLIDEGDRQEQPEEVLGATRLR